MTIKTLKKIGKTVACFLVALVAMTVIVPVLATILGVVGGILLPFVILIMLINLLTPYGREELVKPCNNKIPWFKKWHLCCLFPIAPAVCSIPVLFVLSLILHWHLAATIVLGIVVSLAIIAVAISLTVFSYRTIISPKEEQGDSLMDTNFKGQIKYNDIIGNFLNNKSGYFKSLNKNEDDANKNDSSCKSLPLVKQNKTK